MKDTFKTIKEPVIGEYTVKASRFITYGFSVESEEEWQQALMEVKKAHPKANHHCYAYRLGTDDNNYRANDDGEPSGTAGKPILGQLRSFDVTNTIVIVVRYFGGTLLGASGLISAYKKAAAGALEQATIIEKSVSDIYRLTFEYSIMTEVMNTVKRLKLKILRKDLGANGVMDIAIPQKNAKELMPQLRAGIAKVHLEMVEDMEKIPGLEMEFLGSK